MKIAILGVRGSVPVPSGKTSGGKDIRTLAYGGNTTSIYIQGRDQSNHIVDMGTGARAFGIETMEAGHFPSGTRTANVYITHTHWDHIQALPFFGPAYSRDYELWVYGEEQGTKFSIGNGELPDRLADALTNRKYDLSSPNGQVSPEIFVSVGLSVRDVLSLQQRSRNFPAPLDAMVGIQNIYDFTSNKKVCSTGLMSVHSQKVNHPGGCVSYKFVELQDDKSDRKAVFTSDFEPGILSLDEALIKFWEGADVVIADAQYEPEGLLGSKNKFVKGWGHSDYKTDIIFATRAGVKKLLLTHLEPKMNDDYYEELQPILEKEAADIAAKLRMDKIIVEVAKEGTWIDL